MIGAGWWCGEQVVVVRGRGDDSYMVNYVPQVNAHAGVAALN